MPTIDGRGPLKWDDLPLIDGPAGDVALTLDGYTIQGAIAPWSSGWSPAGSRILMGDGTIANQLTLPKPKQPITMEPRRGAFEITVAYQDDLVRIHRAANRGVPVLAFFGEPHEDQWRIDCADAGQTTWRTSRRVSWNGTTRTHVTHPPKVYIDSTSQTIVTAGTPGTGEAKVPTTQTSGQYYETVTTPALSAGTYLVFRYWPESLVYLYIENTYAAAGEYRISVTMEETLAGSYD